MKRPTPPTILTAEDPVSAYESAIPLLLEILPDGSGSSCLIRDIVWSIYNNHPVCLSKVCCLDQDRKEVVLALINFRMALGGNSDVYIHQLLNDSGEFLRRAETLALARELGLPFTSYPFTNAQACELAQAINQRDAPPPDRD